MAIGGSGKGIQIIVGTDYQDKDLKRAQKDLNKLSTQAKKTQGPISQLGAGFRKQLTPNLMLAGAAAAAFAVKLGVDAVKAAAAEEQAVARLSQALSNAGESLALGGVEAGIDRMARATGIADDELRPAMITLVNATQDAAEAQDLLSLALDISAGSGRDLGSVTMALGKAANGQVTALRRLGVPLSDAAVKSGDLNAITRELQQTFQGQAAEAADTFQGKINRLGVAFGELQESFGKGFIDGLGVSSNGVDGMAQSIQDLEPIMNGLGMTVGSLVSSIGDIVFILERAIPEFSETGVAAEGAGKGTELMNDGVKGLTGDIPALLRYIGGMRDIIEQLEDAQRPAAETHLDYRDAVERAADRAKNAVIHIGAMGQEITISGEEAEDAAEKFDLFAAAIAKTEQVVAFRQAIDEVGESFKKTNTPVNIFTEKGEENFNTLKGLIESTASFAETQTTLAGKASIASQGISSLTDAFANAKMDPATRALLLEPFQALIDDLAEANVDVSGLQQQLDGLKSKNITVTTEYRFTGSNKQATQEFPAGGGRIGSRRALGRGSDTVPAMLTPGEFVVRKSAVNKFGADVFSQLNRGINPLAGMGTSSAGGGSGVSIGTINVNSAAGERADQSLPRALRRMAFLAGA